MCQVLSLQVLMMSYFDAILIQKSMIRLSEFITKIRNCKTQAQQRAETQKEMSAIRESFSKNQENLRLRNVTKLLFINMMGQDTDFGQMECLKLITANTFIEKRIGYLGLTQLFHERSELLMMATNRIRIDLVSSNNYIVALTLSVLSEICTAEMSKEIAPLIMTIITNGNAYIRKKAILTSTKIIRRSPEFISEFFPKIEPCLLDKQHGVLLGAMAFFETVLVADESQAPRISKLLPQLARIYKSVISSQNPEYQISGTSDPFLQVAIIKLLRYLYKFDKTISKEMTQILLQSHEFICTHKNANNMKNGCNSVLFECFQAMIVLETTPQLRDVVVQMVSRFVSVKDANSKYLTLYILNLLSKYDINAVLNHRSTIYDCLNENDILIRTMALDLLYIIASPQNVYLIVKDLLNTLLNATDDEFIAELALKICLIVDKQSPSRRWYFDTILKVLTLAGQAVKEQSVSSLVHLITATPQLQSYAMIKLFFSANEYVGNESLGKVALYMFGEFGQVLLNNRQVTITEDNLLSLVEKMILRVGADSDTIAYGLSSLFKLSEKTRDRKRIIGIIKSFEDNPSLEVQKRACEYVKLLDPEWNEDRKKEICIPIPILSSAVEMFRPIPIGSTDGALDQLDLTLPEKVDFSARLQQENANRPAQPAVAVAQTTPTAPNLGKRPSAPVPVPAPAPANGDIFDMFDGPSEPARPPAVVQPPPPAVVQPPVPATGGGNFFEQIFLGDAPKAPTVAPVQPIPATGANILGGFGFGGPAPVPGFGTTAPVTGFGGLNLLGGPTIPSVQPVAPVNTGFGGLNLLGGPAPVTTAPAVNTNFLGAGGFGIGVPTAPVAPVTQPISSGGFDLLGGGFSMTPTPPAPAAGNFLGGSTATTTTTASLGGFNLLGGPTTTAPAANLGGFSMSAPSANSFKAYETAHLQIVMNCNKQSADTANISAVFNNKTGFLIENLVLQVAVMKHLKLSVTPLNTTSLQPYSRDSVVQKMKVVNSTPGQKGIVMKIKLMYNVNGTKVSEEGKISNFPDGY